MQLAKIIFLLELAKTILLYVRASYVKPMYKHQLKK